MKSVETFVVIYSSLISLSCGLGFQTEERFLEECCCWEKGTNPGNEIKIFNLMAYRSSIIIRSNPLHRVHDNTECKFGVALPRDGDRRPLGLRVHVKRLEAGCDQVSRWSFNQKTGNEQLQPFCKRSEVLVIPGADRVDPKDWDVVGFSITNLDKFEPKSSKWFDIEVSFSLYGHPMSEVEAKAMKGGTCSLKQANPWHLAETFNCANQQECLMEHLQCNRFIDCEDGSDERGCTYSKTEPPPASKSGRNSGGIWIGVIVASFIFLFCVCLLALFLILIKSVKTDNIENTNGLNPQKPVQKGA